MLSFSQPNRLLTIGICLLSLPFLTGLINPNFTIVDLYNGSEAVHVLELVPAVEGRITAKVTATIKGEAGGAEVVLVVSDD